MEQLTRSSAPRIAGLAALCVAALLSGCGSLLASRPPTVGRVIGVYVELSPGVHAERSYTAAQEGRPLVAEVRLPGRDGTPARIAMMRMDGLDVQPGDSVEVALGERGFVTGARPAPARVVRVEARADTNVARADSAPLARRPLPDFLLHVKRAPAPAAAEAVSLKLSLSETLTFSPRRGAESPAADCEP